MRIQSSNGFAQVDFDDVLNNLEREREIKEICANAQSLFRERRAKASLQIRDMYSQVQSLEDGHGDFFKNSNSPILKGGEQICFSWFFLGVLF